MKNIYVDLPQEPNSINNNNTEQKKENDKPPSGVISE